ncbi:MAG: hypothetical protein ACLS47_07130 [Clostridium sp.]
MLNIANKEYVVCHKCCYKINSYVNGNITVDDIISDVTDKDVAAYLMNLKSEKEKGNVRIDHKVMMQQNNPLYDDIHQIAEDLRFIKNFILFCIICSVCIIFLAMIVGGMQ